jgi:hypothetical protein
VQKKQAFQAIPDINIVSLQARRQQFFTLQGTSCKSTQKSNCQNHMAGTLAGRSKGWS